MTGYDRMQMYLMVLVSGSLQVCTQEGERLPSDFLYFPNLEAIKSYFRTVSHPHAREILETFENDCLYMVDPRVSTDRRKPFIVVEGNHRGSKDVVAMKIAQRLRARYLNNLAPCLFDHFKKLSKGSVIRRVFYLLSVYASVFNAKMNLHMNRAVVLNGYWWEQVTFSLLQALRDAPLPPVTSEVFQSPPDLLQPDLVVYVDQPGNPETWSPSLYRNRSMELYRMLSARHPIMMKTMTRDGFKTAIDDIYLNIRENLSDHRLFREDAYDGYQQF